MYYMKRWCGGGEIRTAASQQEAYRLESSCQLSSLQRCWRGNNVFSLSPKFGHLFIDVRKQLFTFQEHQIVVLTSVRIIFSIFPKGSFLFFFLWVAVHNCHLKTHVASTKQASRNGATSSELWFFTDTKCCQTQKVFSTGKCSKNG